jgi:hypothetical protein
MFHCIFIHPHANYIRKVRRRNTMKWEQKHSIGAALLPQKRLSGLKLRATALSISNCKQVVY